MTIKITLPRLPAGAAANIIGLAGLVAVALAVGGLTSNWWWSALSGGVFAVALAYVAQTHAAAEQATARPAPVAEAPRATRTPA